MEPSATTIQSVVSELEGASRALDRAAQALSRSSPSRVNREAPVSRLTPGDRLTSKQLGAIRAAAKRGGVTPERLAELVAQASETASDVVELTRREASLLIDRLDEISGYRS